MDASVENNFYGVRLNNTLTRLIAVLLLMAVIKVAAVSIGQALTDTSRSDELLSKYSFEETPEPKGIPTFTEYVGGVGRLTPEEYNGYRINYQNEYLPKLVDERAGPKPKRGVTEWDAHRLRIEQDISAEFERLFPPKNTDTIIDKAANIGHSAAIGFIKSLRLITYLGGMDNAAAMTLTRVMATHQDAMSETEKIEAQRAIEIIESAGEVSPLTGLQARLGNIRATWVVEALIVPFILLELIFFRKIQSWNWPKTASFKYPTWPSMRRNTVWSKVPKEQAKKHPKYGIKNGLVVLIIYLALSPLAIWGSLNKQLWEAGVTHSQFFTQSDSSVMVVFQILISLGMAGIVLWAMFTKQSKFRRIGTMVFATYFPVFFLLVLIFPSVAMGPAIAQGLIQWVIFGGLWVLYLQRSQRVRVTFEHTIKTLRTNSVGSNDEPTQSPPKKGSQIAITTPTALATEASSEVTESINTPPSPTEMISVPVNTVSTEPPPKVADEDEFLWSEVLKELDSSDRKNGLWAQCYAAHNGHEPAARADYLKTRVDQLRNVRQYPHT